MLFWLLKKAAEALGQDGKEGKHCACFFSQAHQNNNYITTKLIGSGQI